MSPAFGFGAVLHWEKFQFPDGGDPKNKYLIVLGAQTGQDVIIVIADSFKPKHVVLAWGCNETTGYYVLPGDGKNFFTKDTVVKLRPYRAKAAELVKRGIAGEVRIAGNLPPPTANGIRNCLKKSPDISADEIALLQ